MATARRIATELADISDRMVKLLDTDSPADLIDAIATADGAVRKAMFTARRIDVGDPTVKGFCTREAWHDDDGGIRLKDTRERIPCPECATQTWLPEEERGTLVRSEAEAIDARLRHQWSRGGAGVATFFLWVATLPNSGGPFVPSSNGRAVTFRPSDSDAF